MYSKPPGIDCKGFHWIKIVLRGLPQEEAAYEYKVDASSNEEDDPVASTKQSRDCVNDGLFPGESGLHNEFAGVARAAANGKGNSQRA